MDQTFHDFALDNAALANEIARTHHMPIGNAIDIVDMSLRHDTEILQQRFIDLDDIEEEELLDTVASN